MEASLVVAHGLLPHGTVASWASHVALVVKNLPADAGGRERRGFNPGLGRSPGEGNGKPPQYSVENPTDRGAWQAADRRVAQS